MPSARRWTCRSRPSTAIPPTPHGTLLATDSDGLGIGDINTITFNTCDVAGIAFTVTMKTSPWKIDALSVDSANPNRVKANVSSISAHVSGIGCSADFTGTVHGYYDNSTGDLVIDGTGNELVASNASCLGLITNGDVAGLQRVLSRHHDGDGHVPGDLHSVIRAANTGRAVGAQTLPPSARALHCPQRRARGVVQGNTLDGRK